jgi:hypothetical protein
MRILNNQIGLPHSLQACQSIPVPSGWNGHVGPVVAEIVGISETAYRIFASSAKCELETSFFIAPKRHRFEMVAVKQVRKGCSWDVSGRCMHQEGSSSSAAMTLFIIVFKEAVQKYLVLTFVLS